MTPWTLAAFLGAAGLLTLTDVAANGELAPDRLLARLLFLGLVFAGGWLARQWKGGGFTALALAFLSALGYGLSRVTPWAWLAMGAFWALLAVVERMLTAGQRRPVRWLARAGLAGTGALLPFVLYQIESRFAEEEFFAALGGLVTAAALYLLLSAWAGMHKPPLPAGSRRARLLTVAGGGVLLLVLAGIALHAYRISFYPAAAPGYPGLSSESPFVCGQVPQTDDASEGAAVWARLVSLVEAQPQKTPLDLAFLALAQNDEGWADAFRQAILTEARAGAFTGPANSIKSVQFEAALRVYSLAQMQRAFPALFTAPEWAEVKAWVSQINERAFRPEWVDGLYAFAFGTPLRGPYANQEIGQGLLSALNWSALVPEALEAQNRALLQEMGGGWEERFRNTDDAYLYQIVWLIDAYLQNLGKGPGDEALLRNQRLAFDWLLLQARPDGTAPPYNHPIRPELAHIGYLGAALLDDPRYVWLADRASKALEREGGALPAIPGIEKPLSLAGRAPTVGSCLLYGDSGLPTRSGPLAPDKIVFRDGWRDDSTWLALNLRFSGWHRYKATNSLIGLYQGQPVIVEQGRSQPYAWLPAGRSLPRDKRLAREDLNGLLLPQQGLGQVLWTLTGLGSRWAQDPPPYARVERFETLGGLDLSRTTLDDWHDWDQARTIYFFPGGPVFIVDEARADGQGGKAALSWHLAGEGQWAASSLQLPAGSGRVEMVWPEAAKGQIEAASAALPDGAPGWDVVYYAPNHDQLDLATAYLGPEWAGAEVDLEGVSNGSSQGWLLEIDGAPGRQRVLHNSGPGRLEAGGLATDGLALTVREMRGKSHRICYVGGTDIHVSLAHPPANVIGNGFAWRWADGVLVLNPQQPGAAGCVEVQD